MNFDVKSVIRAISLILILAGCSSTHEKKACPDDIQVVLDNTTVLKYDRGKRLPLYLWPATGNWELNSDAAEQLVKELDKRGVGLVCSWKSKDSSKLISGCLTVAEAQKKLGLKVNIEATDLMYFFFNGDERTAHIDENGITFFDESFGKHKMGCPFAIDFRKKEIRDRFEFFLKKYKDEGLEVDFIFTDWEIDGPLEVNGAFAASKRCTRCCRYLGKDFTYEQFQKRLREMRSYLQNYSYSQPVLNQFPDALVGNYAVYPNDGYRYWYDYFEYWVEGQPYKADQRAKYRKWYNDFPATGYTYAMPVCYTWSPSWFWYDFENTEYRWFYNMLLVGSNAGKSKPQNIPVITFVHRSTVLTDGEKDTTIKQMSKESYQELLWHLLLRGTDTFFLWAEKSEYPEEVRLVHEVYSAAQQYGEFLDHGIPVSFDVPDTPGTVISGLALGDSVLIRRTDFGLSHEPVEFMAGTKPVLVEYSPGELQNNFFKLDLLQKLCQDMKDLLISALKVSGEKLIEYFNKPLETKQKESQSSIVTEADIESEALIIDLIQKSFPGHNIISEERGFINYLSEYTWVIDPLDGTSNFAAGIPWFGTLISLFRHNTPIMGGAYLPVQDILYFAEAGKGAFRNGKPLRMPENRELKDSLFAFCVDYTEDMDFLNRGLEIYKLIIKGSRNVRSTNSLIDFIYVAEGKFGGVLNMFTKVWDIAGLGLIISEAGCIMKNIDGNNIHYNLNSRIIEENFPVIAGTLKVVNSIIDFNNNVL